MLSNLSNGNGSEFFQLYAIFLEIDSTSSFLHGRNRSLIRDFYNVYYWEAMYKQALKDKNSQDELNKIQNKLQEGKKSLKGKFRDYMDNTRKYRIQIWLNPHTSSTYPHIIENPNISQAFLHLVDAIEQYDKWRSNLNNEQILKIYIKNLEDRQKYYTDGDAFDEFNEKLLQKIDTSKLKNNKMLKQTLIEFHNAISHLVAVYYGRNQENNKNRAINHFKRGALDSYKAIIKDFYYLYHGNDKKFDYNPIGEIENIRKKEYSGIGSDDTCVFDAYKKITDDMIQTLSPTKA